MLYITNNKIIVLKIYCLCNFYYMSLILIKLFYLLFKD